MKQQSLRSMLKPAKISELKKLTQQEDEILSLNRGGGDYVNLKDGKNKVRWWPAHPEKTKYLVPVSKIWLTITKDNQELGKTTALNGKLHGGLSKDVCEEYARLAKKFLKKTDDEEADTKTKLLDNNMKGLVYGTTWTGYADIQYDQGGKFGDKTFGLLEIKKSVRDAMNDQAFNESEDEEISIDPFTDPDSGRPITITYNSKAKKAQDYYKTTVSAKALPLDDKDIEEFMQRKHKD
jgi:hypothetical protein